MITIAQLQELKEIEDYNPLEKAIHTICIVDSKIIDDVEEMTVKDLFARFNEIVKEIELGIISFKISDILKCKIFDKIKK